MVLIASAYREWYTSLPKFQVRLQQSTLILKQPDNL